MEPILNKRLPELSKRGGYTRGGRTGVRREPLRTFDEMASEFGVSVRSLKGIASNYTRKRNSLKPLGYALPALPQPVARSIHGTYYRPSEMRAWWEEAQRQEYPKC